MIRVCPKPEIWSEIYLKLSKIAKNDEAIPIPPIALILAGWNFSDDFEKKNRWDQTLEWIKKYGGYELIIQLTEEDFYCVDQLQRHAHLDYQWGETYPPATKPSTENLDTFLLMLKNKWEEIADQIALKTVPVSFSGKKARRLNILVLEDLNSPWGTWGWEAGGYHNQKFTNKSAFTNFRKKINDVIQHHKVDHIVFKTGL